MVWSGQELVIVVCAVAVAFCPIASRPLVGLVSNVQAARSAPGVLGHVLNGAVIGETSIVGAGALVTKNTVVPPGSLILGSPAKVKRALTEEEIEHNRASAAEYCRAAKEQLPAVCR